MPRSDGPVILFDGECTLCDRSVQFVLDHDARGRFRFASLQSVVGQRLTAEHGLSPSALDTIVLIDGGRAYIRSEAALRIARGLDPPWSGVRHFRAVPRPLRDAVYDWVARNRTRWFGTETACRLPTPEFQARFLDL